MAGAGEAMAPATIRTVLSTIAHKHASGDGLTAAPFASPVSVRRIGTYEGPLARVQTRSIRYTLFPVWAFSVVGAESARLVAP
jgi:hypothetical protein